MTSRKPRRRKKRDTLVLKLLLAVAVVLVIFEGNLIKTMFTHRSVTADVVADGEANHSKTEGGTVTNKDTDTDEDPALTTALATAAPGATLAGLTLGDIGSQPAATQQTEAPKLPTVSNPDSEAIVRKADTPVDDSWFSDAVFIGDSRMEGFRNASGITQGRFFTSVGMSLSSMAKEPVIATKEGNITVAAALSGGRYNKIYIMLGANDLGEYDWDSFHDGFVSVTKRFLEIQPGASMYICSCIYVEESKVKGGDYINNANVDKLNSILLQVCEDEGYYYLDLNEFLSNGYGALIDGASSDGVHLYEKYCKQILEYLKSHYVPVESDTDADDGKADGDSKEDSADNENKDDSKDSASNENKDDEKA